MTTLVLLHHTLDAEAAQAFQAELMALRYRVLPCAYDADYDQDLLLQADAALLAFNPHNPPSTALDAVLADMRWLHEHLIIAVAQEEQIAAARLLLKRLPSATVTTKQQAISRLPPSLSTRQLSRSQNNALGDDERSQFIRALEGWRAAMNPSMSNLAFIQAINQHTPDQPLSENDFYNYFTRPNRAASLPLIWLLAVIRILQKHAATFHLSDALKLAHKAGVNPDTAPLIRRAIERIFPATGNWTHEVPQQPHLIGRRREVADLAYHLLRPGACVLLMGLPGIGKTNLAQAAVYTLLPHFTAIYWVDLRLNYALDDLNRLLRMGQRVPREPADQIRDILRILAEQRILLVLDHCEQLLNDARTAFRPEYEAYQQLLEIFLARDHQSGILVISNTTLPGLDAMRRYQVSVWVQILEGIDAAAIAEMWALEGIALDERQVAQIYSTTSGHPVLLHALRNRALPQAEATASALAGSWRVLQDYLKNQLAQMDDAAQKLLFWLVILRDWVTLADLALLFERSQPHRPAQHALERLNSSFLIEVSEDRLRLKQFALDFFNEQLLQVLEEEFLSERLNIAADCGIVLASAPAWIQAEQRNHLLRPLYARLLRQLGSQNLVRHLRALLRHEAAQRASYLGANLLHLLDQAQGLAGVDASQVYLAEADLRTNLHDARFAGAVFDQCIFHERHNVLLRMALHPQRNLLAASSNDGWVHLWRLHPFTKLWGQNISYSWLRGLAFTAHGDLLSSRTDESLANCNLESGQPQSLSIPFTHGEVFVLTTWQGLVGIGGASTTFALWDWQAQRCLWEAANTPAAGWCYAAAFSPDGALIAIGGEDGSVVLRTTHDGREVLRIETQMRILRSLAFVPSDGRLICGGGDHDLVIVDLADGRMTALRGHLSTVHSLSLAPDGLHFASGDGDGMIYIWRLADLTCVQVLEAHQGWVRDLIYIHPGLLASSGNDRALRLWSLPEGRLLTQSIGQMHGVRRIALSPDGQQLASAGEQPAVHLWSLPAEQPPRTLHSADQSWARWLEFSPDERQLAVAHQEDLLLYDLASGDMQHRLRGHEEYVACAAYAPDGRWLVSTGEDSSLRKWDARRGVLLAHRAAAHSRWIWRVRVLPDGERLLTLGADGLLAAWDADLNRLDQQQAHAASAWGLALHPDGTLIATSSSLPQEGIRLWRIQGPHLESLLTLPMPHQRDVEALAFSPDGRYLAAGSFDASISLWEVATQTLLHLLHGHEDKIYDLRWNGAGLFSASVDGTIRRWDAASGAVTQVLRPQRAYEGMRIGQVQGLPPGMAFQLAQLGALRS